MAVLPEGESSAGIEKAEKLRDLGAGSPIVAAAREHGSSVPGHRSGTVNSSVVAMAAMVVPMMAVVPMMPDVTVTTIVGQRHPLSAAGERGCRREVRRRGRLRRSHEKAGKQRQAEGHLLHP